MIPNGIVVCPETGSPSCPQKILTFSSMDQTGPVRQAKLLDNHLVNQESHEHDTQYLEDLAFTLTTKRSILPWRSFVVADGSLNASDSIESQLSIPTKASNGLALAFIFTGQGVQWAGMGKQLLKHLRFSESLDAASRVFKSCGCAWSLTGRYSLYFPGRHEQVTRSL